MMTERATLQKPRSIYITASDRHARRSKTITVRAAQITVDDVIAMIRKAIDIQARKAG